MFTRILVPTDFSRPSDAALTHARSLAGSTGATLHVLHVVDNLFLRAVLADPRDYETAALRQLQDRVPVDDRGAPAILVVERSDEPAAEITSYAHAHSIDLIVMGTHGRGRMAHLLLGSVAEKVARTAPCPVLTMRDHPLAASVEGLRILVPTDLSACSDAAVGTAKRLAAKLGGSVRMLHVIESPAVGASFGSELFVPEAPGVQSDRTRDARIQLSGRILTDSRSRVTVTADVIQGPVGAMITAYAEANGFDLIVMGTRGRGGLAHVLMGSIAESVIRTAPCPVLTVKSSNANQVRTANADAA
jgi:nucleotide-binding universal stress UspA family protein